MSVEQARLEGSRLGPTRTQVLDHLRHTGQALTVEKIATTIGLHPNTARFHLDSLVEANFVRRDPDKRGRPGRPRLLYRAVAALRPSIGRPYQDLAGVLISSLGTLEGGADEAEAAGHRWGRHLAAERTREAPLERVVRVLDALGYQPVAAGEPVDHITLRPCPFTVEGLARCTAGELPAVCRLHLGMMRGLLGETADVTVTDLEVFATPTTCVARLAPAVPAPAPAPASPATVTTPAAVSTPAASRHDA